MGERSTSPVLSRDLVDTFGERAAQYDRKNTFFHEDFEDLRRAGYLKVAVPRELGGLGLDLAQVAAEQRRLAYRAPATALATNMHIYWTGVAADLYRQGDRSLEWILREAVAGEVFAAGHGESGNDVPLFFSTTKAERVDGGYRFYGHKIFGSLSPVWTRFGLHGVNLRGAQGPEIVHAFLSRDSAGYVIKETWDALGMRATRSDDTVIEGAFVPDRYVARVLPQGGADAFVLAVFAWVEALFGSIYVGLTERARDIAVETARKRHSVALTRSLAHHPEVQHAVAEIELVLEGTSAQVDRVAADWAGGVEHGARWPLKLVAAKHNAVEGAKRAVDLALAVTGGSGIFKTSELERLYRDVRCGGFHPANTLFAFEVIGKSSLGVGLTDPKRWG